MSQNVDLQTALADAYKLKAEKEARRQELDAELDAIDGEINGLEHAIARYNGQVPTNGLSASQLREWKRLARTDAIVRVLEMAGEPLSPAEITTRLHGVGRHDERNLVAAAIAYLKNGHRVHSLGRGQWVPGPEGGDVQ